ncbi:hypothetical protein ACSV9I_05555 [Rhizobium sp. G187]|uniref:hypothetical protein n=1 Tax=Rhizobium sp. G187 TaxID=3451352 RepID=UPI003EE68087
MEKNDKVIILAEVRTHREAMQNRKNVVDIKHAPLNRTDCSIYPFTEPKAPVPPKTT